MIQVGEEEPHPICILREGGTECMKLDLLVDEYTEFSVLGSGPIHLAGYYMMQDEDGFEDGFEEDDEDGFEDGFEEDDDDFDEIDLDPKYDGSRPLLGFDAEGEPIFLGDEDLIEDGTSEEDWDDEEDSSEEDLELVQPEKRKVLIEDVTEQDGGEKGKKDVKKAAGKQKEEKKRKVTAEDGKEKNKEKKLKERKEETLKEKSRVRRYPNGFEIHDLQFGSSSGKLAKAGKRVSVKYVGKLKNGSIFDQTKGRKTFQFRLGVGEVIKGWDRGVEGMRVGDKRKIVVPPQMGYGSSKVGPIPPNSTLTFEVELVDVKN